MGWKLLGFPSEWTRTVWKGCEAYRGTKCWRAMAKGSRGVLSSLLTLLDGRAAAICGLHRGASGLRRTAKNVCHCNLVHSRQTHAVTFWLCSSIVVAIFVTFWNDSLLRIKTLIINMLFPPPAGCDWRFDHRVWLDVLTQAPRPLLFDQWVLKSVLCSLKTATTFTGLFITAKLFAAIFKCRATQSPALVCHVICCDAHLGLSVMLTNGGPIKSWMIARVERGRAGHRREWISVVDPSGCSSCALVLNSLKRSALVYKGEGNASMSEIRIRNDLRGLA